MRLKGAIEKGKETIGDKEIMFLGDEMLEHIDESFDDVIQLYFASPNGLQMELCFKWDLQLGLTTL